MLDPRQQGGDNEKAEFVAAREKNENDAANRQHEANADNAFAALDEIDDGSVNRAHGRGSLGSRPVKSQESSARTATGSRRT